MKVRAGNIRSLMLILGIMLALILFLSQKIQAQENPDLHYKCTPCGCSADNTLVKGPGNCKTCGMTLINIKNPSEGLNYTNLYANQVCDLLTSNPDILILDVRSEGEFEQRTSKIGHFQNAINIPITEVQSRLDELTPHKHKEILVYCSISARSPRVSKLLADNGFTKIRNLMGGLNAWNQTSLDELPRRDELVIKP